MLFMPFAIHAQDIGIEYSYNKYLSMDQETLHNKLVGVDVENTLSIALLPGGAVATGYGAYYGIAGTIIVLGGTIYESPLVAFMGSIAIAGGVLLSCAGVTAGVIAYRAIEKISDRKNDIKVALMQFNPVSYNHKLGLGIGISIPLNTH